MRCLLVKAHPVDASLCQTLSDAAAEFLTARGHECRLIDLYQSGFAPALTKIERQTYYSGFDRSAVTREIDDLLWAEVIVLVFPTWWFGFPAILKGWFDRVWAPGVAYDHAADLGTIRPRLHDLRNVVSITTLGSPWWADWLVLRRPVRRVLKGAILRACAPKAALTFVSIYKAEQLSHRDVEAAVARIRNVLERL